jgi:hypothetical protein
LLLLVEVVVGMEQVPEQAVEVLVVIEQELILPFRLQQM